VVREKVDEVQEREMEWARQRAMQAPIRNVYEQFRDELITALEFASEIMAIDSKSRKGE
jgi:hypothetical protein